MNLRIRNLHASVEGKDILRGIDLTVEGGEVHAIMGPNGSGKSTLASVLLGHPSYTVPIKGKSVKGSVVLGKKELLTLSTEDRAKAGLFLAFQSPVAIPGVTVMNLLRAAYEERQSKQAKRPKSVQNPVLARRFTVGNMPIGEFSAMVERHAEVLNLSPDLLRRGIHDGFSGGERKKIEMLQALVLPSSFAIFDEIDTGLDVDALRAVSRGIQMLRKKGVGILIITHYQRILKYVKPDHVHVMIHGVFADHGTSRLAKTIEQHGYGSYLEKTA